MQSNTGNTGGNMWQDAAFVTKFEMAAMQFVILSKAQQGEVTRDNLQQTFKGNLQMGSEHFEHCLTELVQDGHLKEIGGNKYTLTDDGREDVQKLMTLVQELPNVVNQGGQKQGMTQTAGRTGGNVSGGQGGGNISGGQGGSKSGTTGDVGKQNMGQPKGGPGNSSR